MVIWKKSCTFATSYPENNLFTLMETNTYWRFGAVACEGHRFFFALNFPSSLAQTSQAHIQLFIHFIQYVKKENISYCILIIKEKIPYPLPTFIFPWASKNFSVGTQKKNHGQTAKNKSAIKPHSNKGKKIILQGKKLPSHSKIVHTNRTLKDSIKKEQIFHYLYGFI